MRLKLKDLQPGTRYSIQLRAVSNTAVSGWSRKFSFTTTADSRKPSVPQNITWIPVGSSFHAAWDEVHDTEAGTPTSVSRYEVELMAGGKTRYRSVPQNPEGSVVHFYLTRLENKSLFGNMQTTVKMRVRAVGASGRFSSWSAQYTAVNGAPSAPTNGRAKSILDGVELGWDAPPDDDLAGYKVFVSTAGPDFVPSPSNLVGMTDFNATSYIYVTSTYMMHYFKVRAVDEFGLESPDLVIQGQPKSPFDLDDTPPNVPVAVNATLDRVAGKAAANLTWGFDETAPDQEDIQGFAIQWRQVGTEFFNVVTADKYARSARIELPKPYADYEFAVASFDWAANYSAWSDYADIQGTIPGAPDAPVSIVGTPGLDNIDIEWSPSLAEDVTYGGHYTLEFDDNAAFTSPQTYDTENNRLQVSGLAPTTTYYFRVKAVDTSGQVSLWTAGNADTTAFPVTPKNDGYAPGSSPTPTVTGGIGSLFVEWDAVTTNSKGDSQDDVVTYEIHVSDTSGFTPTVGGPTKAGEVSGTVTTIRNLPGTTTPLAYSTTYYVKIIAKDLDGEAAPSTEASGTTKQATTIDIADGSITTDKMIANSISGDRIIANTLSASKIATGSLESAVITLAAGGQIKSSDYATGVSGFSLSGSGLEIVDGVISAKAITSGTITGSKEIILGAGAWLTADSTSGGLRSNTYKANSANGWKLDNAGLVINEGSVKANAIVGGTIGAQTISLSSGGYIQSSNWNGVDTGWRLGGTGTGGDALTIYNGTVSGNTITTGQIKSNQPARDVNGTSLGAGTYAWFIDMQGDAVFGNALVQGRLTVGSASYAGTSGMQSYNYSPGAVGWRVRGDGYAEFMNATINGTGTFRANVGSSYVILNPTTGLEAVNGEYKILIDPTDIVKASGTGSDVGPKIRLKTSANGINTIQATPDGLTFKHQSGTQMWLEGYTNGNSGPGAYFNEAVYADTGVVFSGGQRIRRMAAGNHTQTASGGTWEFAHSMGVLPDTVIITPKGSTGRYATWNKDNSGASYIRGFAFAPGGAPLGNYTIEFSWVAIQFG